LWDRLYLTAENRKEFSEQRGSYESTSWATTNPDLLVEKGSFYFLISRDGRFIIPTAPYYLYAGQWGSDCPFRTIAPIMVNAVGDLSSIMEKIIDIE